MTDNNTAVTAPKKNDLKSLMVSPYAKEQFALALPKHLTVDRFVRIALTAFNKNPNLLECTQESVMSCMMDCSSLGIEPDGRRAHLIPYGNKCTLIIDYKGLIELAKRSGDVKSWSAVLICEKDVFTWHNGEITHDINWLADRGRTMAVYSHVVLSDGEHDYEVMTLAEVDAIRKRSKASGSGPWVTDFSEMAKKTVIRRHSKRLTLSPEFRDAEAKDGDVIDLVEGDVYVEKFEEASAKLKAKAAKASVVAPVATPDPVPPVAVDTPANTETLERETQQAETLEPTSDEKKERAALIEHIEKYSTGTPKKLQNILTTYNMIGYGWREKASMEDLRGIAKRFGG